MININQLQ